MININSINISGTRHNSVLITIYFQNVLSATYFGIAEYKNIRQIKSSFAIVQYILTKPLGKYLSLRGNALAEYYIDNVYYQNKLKYLDKYCDRNK
jgi:hypothetical protein